MNKYAFIDKERLINETAVGHFKPFNAMHTGTLGAALGGLGGAGGSFILDTILNQTKDPEEKKSTKEKIKKALLIGLIGAGAGGIGGGIYGAGKNKKITDKSYDLLESEIDKNVNPILNSFTGRLAGYAPIVLADEDREDISKLVAASKLRHMSQNPTKDARKEEFSNFLDTMINVGKENRHGRIGKEVAIQSKKSKNNLDDLMDVGESSQTSVYTGRPSEEKTLGQVFKKQSSLEALKKITAEETDPNIVSEFLQLPDARRTAGRHAATQEMLGENADFNLAYPRTNRLISTLIPAAAAGAAAYKLSKDSPNRDRNILASVGAGMLLGTFIDTMMRRKSRKKSRENLQNEIDAGVNNSDLGDLDYGTAFGGVHQQGRMDALEAKLLGKTRFQNNPILTGLEIAARVPGVTPVAAPLAVLGDLVQGGKAQMRMMHNRPQVIRSVQS